jgi:hypothetical protein
MAKIKAKLKTSVETFRQLRMSDIAREEDPLVKSVFISWIMELVQYGVLFLGFAFSLRMVLRGNLWYVFFLAGITRWLVLDLIRSVTEAVRTD